MCAHPDSDKGLNQVYIGGGGHCLMSVKSMLKVHGLSLTIITPWIKKKYKSLQNEYMITRIQDYISLWLHHPLIHHYNPLTNKDL